MATPDSSSNPETLYPKITGNLTDLLKNIKWRLENDEQLKGVKSIDLTGTVKLHGMHADIVVNSDNSFRIQSRNVHNITLKNDLHGLAAHLLTLNDSILALKKKIHDRFLELNPTAEINSEHPLIIAGEWIGRGIQKKVAIAELPQKLFVIISININNEWQPDEPYADVHDEEHQIYNISKSGFSHATLPLREAITELRRLQPLADAVEDECPFGKVFGITGRGEGIVWKPNVPLCHDAKYWIKMKGPLTKVRPVAEKKVGKDPKSQKEYAVKFAKSVLVEMRLEQGWQYLEETGVQRNKKAVVAYLKWLTGDVEIEEKSLIEERELDWGVLRKEIENVGREWYFKRLLEEK